MGAAKREEREMKKLYRSKNERMIAGVCGGIAEYFGWDPSIVRVVCAVLALSGGCGLLAYIVAALIIPEGSTLSVS